MRVKGQANRIQNEVVRKVRVTNIRMSTTARSRTTRDSHFGITRLLWKRTLSLNMALVSGGN